MLIDKVLPAFDVGDDHRVHIAAEPARVYAAFPALDFTRSRVVRTLFAIRSLPSRLRGRTPESPLKSGPQPILPSMLALGWRVLEEIPGRELVAGAVTRPWAPEVRFRGLAAPDFAAFAEPGFTKIAWNFAVRPAARGGTVASAQTRVLCMDATARRRFRRYWLVFGVGIRWIHRALLHLLKRELEGNRR